MARGAVLTHLLGVWLLQVALIVKISPGALGLPPQSSRHVDLPEENNDAEFRSNSMGVSKVIDLNTGTIAYKDHILKSCYIEKINAATPWNQDRMLIIHPKLLTNDQVALIGGNIVANFCLGWPSRILRLPTNYENRTKRSNQQYYFVGRKTRGQSQSQYLQFGEGEPGKAEAESTRQGSKAIVYGSRGMGQAQSQSDPFSCADCFGPGGKQFDVSGRPILTTSIGAGGGPGSLQTDIYGRPISGTDGRQFDSSGRPITSTSTGTRPGSEHTDIYGKPISGTGGADGRQLDASGRPITSTSAGARPGSQQTGIYGTPISGTSGTEGRQFDASGRPITSTGSGTGAGPGGIQTDVYGRPIGGTQQTGYIPGRPGSLQQPSGQAPGQLLFTPDGKVIQPGGTTTGQTSATHPGRTGTSFVHPGSTITGGPSYPSQYFPGQRTGTQQIHPSQTGGIQTTISGPGATTQTYPGQAPGTQQIHPGQTGQTIYQQEGTGGSGTGATFIPGQSASGTIGGPGTILRPGQIQPGSTIGGPGTTTQYIPGHTQPSQPTQTTIGGPGTGTIIFSPGQVPASLQTYPGSGQTVGTTQTRPGNQIYDHGGIQRPSGRPIHSGDVGLITPPSGQPQQAGITTQPGQTTYFIPGGIRPRPGEGSYGYYPSTSTQGGRIQTTDTSSQDGTFNGQVAGHYRPAGGPGGEFSGTFQGRYSPQGSEVGQQGIGGVVQQTHPGALIGSGEQGTISQQGYPGHQGTTGGQITSQVPGQYIQGGETQGGTTTGQGIGTQTWPGQPGQAPGQLETGGGQPGYQQGIGVTPGSRQYPGSSQPGYQQGSGQALGQLQTGGGQPGYQQATGLGPGSGQYPGSSQPGYQEGSGQLQAGGGQPGYQQGAGLASGSGQYPGSGQPGYQHGSGLRPGQIQTTTGGQYPGTTGSVGQIPTGAQQFISGGGQPGYQQEVGVTPGQITTSTGAHYPGGVTGPTGSLQPGYHQQGLLPGHVQTTGGQYPGANLSPGQQQTTTGGQYPGGGTSPTGLGQTPGQIQTTNGQYPGANIPPGQLQTAEGQYPEGGTSQTRYPQGSGQIPGQLQTTPGGQYPITGGSQPGFQQGLGGTSGQGVTTIGSQYPTSGTGQIGYQPGAGIIPGGQYPSGVVGQGQGGPGHTPFAGGTGQHQGVGGLQVGGGIPGSTGLISGGAGDGTYQGGQYQAPGALIAGQTEADDSDTQAQSTIQRADNETQASASSSGRYAGGNAQSQVSGTYAGSGSFSASAGTNDGLRGAQTQVSGNSEGTLSSSQGVGGRAKSQAQVQLSADTGDTTSSAQTSGLNHGTNSQVQSGIKGGMADAQANGPGSTSSQAQIGFTPYDATNNDDDPGNPHNGGGTASASSGTHAGKSQVQINGKYAFGIRYTGQAQASSANSGFTAENINLPTMKPIDFSQTTFNKPAKQAEKVNVRQIDDPSLVKIITSSTTPSTNGDDDDEEEYEDYEDSDPAPPTRQNLIQQAKTRSLMHDALDPLEDIDDHGMEVQGQLKHGDIIQTGHFIPGSIGYKIPQGFRGRVTEEEHTENYDADHNSNRKIIYAAGANANRRGGYHGYGSGYSYQPRFSYSPLQYGFKSSAQPKNFVSVTKSETGSRNVITGKKTPSVYYTQSSTCGYFTNTCVYSNGRKICLPKPKANPDGTPILCRN